MKVGLVRHFEVECQMPNISKLMTPNQFRQWLQEYEMSDIKYGTLELSMIKWDKCYSSDLPRAIKTAQKIYDGQIIETRALRELVIYPPTDINIKLPILMWLIFGRMAWMLSHKSQLENRLIFKERVNYIVKDLMFKGDKNVLIVSHGFLMVFLRKALLKHGFKGPDFRKAENGKLYIFEK